MILIYIFFNPRRGPPKKCLLLPCIALITNEFIQIAELSGTTKLPIQDNGRLSYLITDHYRLVFRAPFYYYQPLNRIESASIINTSHDRRQSFSKNYILRCYNAAFRCYRKVISESQFGIFYNWYFRVLPCAQWRYILQSH